MSPEEKNLEIHKLLGWETSPDGKKWKSPYGRYYTTWRKRCRDGVSFLYENKVTDYHGGEGNIAYVEHALLGRTFNNWLAYEAELSGILGPEAHPLSASPAQRVDALLKMHGAYHE